VRRGGAEIAEQRRSTEIAEQRRSTGIATSAREPEVRRGAARGSPAVYSRDKDSPTVHGRAGSPPAVHSPVMGTFNPTVYSLTKGYPKVHNSPVRTAPPSKGRRIASGEAKRASPGSPAVFGSTAGSPPVHRASGTPLHRATGPRIASASTSRGQLGPPAVHSPSGNPRTCDTSPKIALASTPHDSPTVHSQSGNSPTQATSPRIASSSARVAVEGGQMANGVARTARPGRGGVTAAVGSPRMIRACPLFFPAQAGSPPVSAGWVGGATLAGGEGGDEACGGGNGAVVGWASGADGGGGIGSSSPLMLAGWTGGTSGAGGEWGGVGGGGGGGSGALVGGGSGAMLGGGRWAGGGREGRTGGMSTGAAFARRCDTAVAAAPVPLPPTQLLPHCLAPSELLLRWEVARLEQEVHAARDAAAAAQRDATEAEAITAHQQVRSPAFEIFLLHPESPHRCCRLGRGLFRLPSRAHVCSRMLLCFPHLKLSATSPKRRPSVHNSRRDQPCYFFGNIPRPCNVLPEDVRSSLERSL
jgi:hypothetical protein